MAILLPIWWRVGSWLSWLSIGRILTNIIIDGICIFYEGGEKPEGEGEGEPVIEYPDKINKLMRLWKWILCFEYDWEIYWLLIIILRIFVHPWFLVPAALNFQQISDAADAQLRILLMTLSAPLSRQGR